MLARIDGDKLRELRIRKGWTLEALAVRSGVSERAIQDIEKGLTLQPRPNTVRWLAQVLEVEPETLWLDADPGPTAAPVTTAKAPRALVIVQDAAGTLLNRLSVTGDQIRIGRDAGNDVVLLDVKVSLFHALLVLRAEAWELRDLGSANGTFVGGQAVEQPRTLKTGEQVTIASFVIELRPPEDLASPTATLRMKRDRPR